jgi:hypothetical protein
MNDRLAKAEAVFHEALELPLEQREGFLQEACGKDAELCREVAGLLRASGVADEWLNDADCATIEVPGGISEGPGTVIGCYKLREKVGESVCVAWKAAP